MFVVNSRLGFSSVAASSSNRMGLHRERPSFSRSYGCNLQSSLTRVFPRTLGSSPCLPVSVSVRAQFVSLEAFLGSVVRLASARPKVRLPVTSRLLQGGFASLAAYRLRRALPFARSSSLLCHSILMQLRVVLDCSPVVLRLRFLPRLRSRLTLSRRSLLRKP